jgi:hypothetical protein
MPGHSSRNVSPKDGRWAFLGSGNLSSDGPPAEVIDAAVIETMLARTVGGAGCGSAVPAQHISTFPA